MISRENNFDLIRLFAAFQVSFHHAVGYLQISNPLIKVLDNFLNHFPGVPIFFAISGFLIYSSYERNSSIKKYFINRCLRLFPALWVCFVVTMLLLFFFNVIKVADLLNGKMILWILSQLSFLQVWTVDTLRYWGMGIPNPSLQTISIEVQFYIFLPIAIFLLKEVLKKWNYKLKFLILLLISIVLFYLANEKTNNIINVIFGISVFSSLFYFLLGSVIYLNFDRIKFLLEGKVIYWLVVYLLLSYLLDNHNVYLNIVLSTFRALLVISSAYTFTKIGKILKGEDISYGLYVYGMLVVNSFIALGYMHKVGYLVLVLVINVILGIVSWFTIEKNVLNLKNRFK